jgi:hypothetical protein
MAPIKDLTGQRFGRLTAISIVDGIRDGDGSVMWLCRCECGLEKITSSNRLQCGKTKSCGCLAIENQQRAAWKPGEAPRKPKLQLIGDRFGKLTCIEYLGPKHGIKNKAIYWRCQCDCGRFRNVTSHALISGKIQSCGCSRKPRPAGSNNVFWRGRHAPVAYPPEWNHSLRWLVRSRDNFECQYPNCTGEDLRTLHVHHIDGNRANCSMENLISLCPTHHYFVETDRTSWEMYFGIITGDYQ